MTRLTQSPDSDGNCRQVILDLIPLTVGQFVTLTVNQNSGGALSVVGAILGMTWVSP